MDSTIWILLYSKFSPSCIQLFNLIDQRALNIEFTLLCVDDKNMRKRIVRNKQFNIKSVPCILSVHKISGIASQYDGQKVFELIESLSTDNQQNYNNQNQNYNNQNQNYNDQNQNQNYNNQNQNQNNQNQNQNNQVTPIIIQDSNPELKESSKNLDHQKALAINQQKHLEQQKHMDKKLNPTNNIQQQLNGGGSINVTSIDDILNNTDNGSNELNDDIPAVTSKSPSDRLNGANSEAKSQTKLSVASIMAAREQMESELLPSKKG